MAVARSASSAASVLRTSLSSAQASTSRLFTTSAPVQGKSPPGKGKVAIKNAKRAELQRRAAASGQIEKAVVQTMDLEQATKVFQAVESNALRGRLALPKDPRIRSEKFLIFAEDNSPAAQAVLALQQTSPALRDSIVMGGSEMIQDVLDGKGAAGGEFSKVLSTQSLLPQLTRSLARSLGPKGLMPNVKRGTVVSTADEMNRAIKEAQGAINWRGDRNGVVRGAVGRINFSTPELRSNISTFLQAIVDKVNSGLASGASQVGVFSAAGEPGQLSPQALKKAAGVIRQVHLSSTQGPSVLLSLPEVM